MTFTVSREFKEAFDFCMDHYEVTGEELEYEKQRCRENMKEASICYASIAEKLRSKGIVK